MESNRFLPQIIPLIIDERPSSNSITPDYSLAIEVPCIPREKPTSAYYSINTSSLR